MAIFERKDDYGYIQWSLEVKKRDYFACVICGRKGVALNSHHLNAWASFPEQRYSVDNGITLCTFHHEDFHAKFGKGKNTKEQFDEYKKICEALMTSINQEVAVSSTVRKISQLSEKDQVIQAILADLERKKNE
jgi:ABC-type uncharacterized transport system ATPase subunit